MSDGGKQRKHDARKAPRLVFNVSILISGLAGIGGLIWPEELSRLAGGLTRVSLEHFDWLFLISITAFVLMCLVLAVSRFGHIRLGRPEEKPEFGVLSWFAMLFAAGMGIGLMFWGVSEPLVHFASPPPEREGMTAEAARWAMVVTNFHWGLHAWGIYCLGGLVLAYYGFRKGLPMLAGTPIRAVFPGGWGRGLATAADLIAVLAVVFGLAGTLGQGVLQVLAGMHTAFDTPVSVPLAAFVLVSLSLVYIGSASTGLRRGIRFLSDLNMIIAVLLMAFVLLAGPTHFILSTFVTTLGDYAGNLVSLSLRLYPYTDNSDWSRTWTLTYLVWWIAWTPFVGVFIARISRGRTIREFVAGVVLAPTLFSVLWFAIFGGSGLNAELFGSGGLATAATADPERALFSLFDTLPLSNLLSLTAIVLIFIFLVTSADSGSFVLGMMTSHGSLEPPLMRKLFWGLVVAILAAAILFQQGGLQVLRAIAVSGAMPFTLVMIVQAACLMRSLGAEKTPNPAHTGPGDGPS